MREYCCPLGHFFWAKPGRKGCMEPGCPAPIRQTGKRRGALLEDPYYLERFIACVRGAELASCWEWTGPCYTRAPMFTVGCDVRQRARAVSWEMWRGTLPGAGVQARCKNNYCVNPFHLKRVTRRERRLRQR